MASKKKRTPAQIAATARMLAAMKAKRKGTKKSTARKSTAKAKAVNVAPARPVSARAAKITRPRRKAKKRGPGQIRNTPTQSPRLNQAMQYQAY